MPEPPWPPCVPAVLRRRWRAIRESAPVNTVIAVKRSGVDPRVLETTIVSPGFRSAIVAMGIISIIRCMSGIRPPAPRRRRKAFQDRIRRKGDMQSPAGPDLFDHDFPGRGVNLGNGGSDGLKAAGHNFFRAKAGGVGNPIAKRPQLIPGPDLFNGRRLGVGESNRIRGVLTNLRGVLEGDGHRLSAGECGNAYRDLSSSSVYGRYDSANSTPLPLQLFFLLLRRNIAAAHHHDGSRNDSCIALSGDSSNQYTIAGFQVRGLNSPCLAEISLAWSYLLHLRLG